MRNDVNITIDGKQVGIQFPDEFWRDYFAAAAMQGMIASGEYLAERLHKNPNKNMGDMAYMAADEMLAARKEGA
jgi:hypothetical protein